MVARYALMEKFKKEFDDSLKVVNADASPDENAKNFTAGGPLATDCLQPTGEERTHLAQWIACERNRPHNFSDAGVDAP